MNPWKALGADDFSSMFFQECWDTIQQDFVNNALDFLNNGIWNPVHNLDS